jgi:hypothetical protein
MRNYDDELQHFDHPNPPDAPRWAYVDQTDILYDTDIDKSTGDIDMMILTAMMITSTIKFDKDNISSEKNLKMAIRTNLSNYIYF